MAATSVSGAASQSASSRAPMRRDRAVEHAQQRAFAAAVADRARDFQAAARGRVDLQPLARRVRQQPIDVRERRLLRFGQIVEHRAGGAQRGGVASLRRRSRSLRASACRNAWPATSIAAVRPNVQAGPARDRRAARSKLGRQRSPTSSLTSSSAGSNAGELIGQLAAETRPRRTGRSRGRPRQCRRGRRFALAVGMRDRGQEVARLRVEQGIVGERAGRDDPRHFALAPAPWPACGSSTCSQIAARCPAAMSLRQVRFELMIAESRPSAPGSRPCRGW